MNPSNVPHEVVPLLSLAQRWGVGDDVERAGMVESATLPELEALVAAVDAVDEEALYGWLAGPESYSETPTSEYLAVTCLTMAADHARLRLKKTNS